MLCSKVGRDDLVHDLRIGSVQDKNQAHEQGDMICRSHILFLMCVVFFEQIIKPTNERRRSVAWVQQPRIGQKELGKQHQTPVHAGKVL